MTIKLSRKSRSVGQSLIRSMTTECLRVGGINMAQGVCDLEVPAAVLEGAQKAMADGHNVYTSCEGRLTLRKAVAGKMADFYGIKVVPETEVMISCGATGAFYATCLAVLDPGDEVILLEPFYGYHPATLEAIGCVPKFLSLEPPEWKLDQEKLEAMVSARTRAIVINTPLNPLGKVFSLEELKSINSWAKNHNLLVFSDEIYEHFIYDGLTHTPPAGLAGAQERTITISGFSKIFGITGWRMGYAIGPPEVMAAAANFNDLVYVCAPAPLQAGVAKGLLTLGADYYRMIAAEHQQKRDLACAALCEAGLVPYVPQGAYYVLADISGVPGKDDLEKTMYILAKTGVAAVPGRAFFHRPPGPSMARFCFAKKNAELLEACERLQKLKA